MQGIIQNMNTYISLKQQGCIISAWLKKFCYVLYTACKSSKKVCNRGSCLYSYLMIRIIRCMISPLCAWSFLQWSCHPCLEHLVACLGNHSTIVNAEPTVDIHSVCIFHWEMEIEKIYKQAQRRAAEDRSGRKYSKKYVFMNKNMTFGSLGSFCPFQNPS